MRAPTRPPARLRSSLAGAACAVRERRRARRRRGGRSASAPTPPVAVRAGRLDGRAGHDLAAPGAIRRLGPGAARGCAIGAVAVARGRRRCGGPALGDAGRQRRRSVATRAAPTRRDRREAAGAGPRRGPRATPARRRSRLRAQAGGRRCSKSCEREDGASAALGRATSTEPSTKGAGASISSAPAHRREARPGRRRSQVARRFADAFVLYETGQGDARVRAAFGSTATPALAQSLLRRPPRQPASVKVPKAKVLNVVAGPSSGGVYPVSVSLLRVGLTSELRLEMERAKHGNGTSPTSSADEDGPPRLLATRLTAAALRCAARRPSAAAGLGCPPSGARRPHASRQPTSDTRRAAVPAATPASDDDRAGAGRAGRHAGSAAGPAKPPKPTGSGGTSAAAARRGRRPEPRTPAPKPATGAASRPGPAPGPALAIPSLPSSTCAAAGVPPILVPIYQRAAAAYGLGPQGPAVLAGINEVETAFGTNLNVSSAGADRLDAVHALDLGNLRSRRQRRRGRRTPTTPKTRSSPPPATSARPGCRPTPTARSSPTTTPTGTSPRSSPTPSCYAPVVGAHRRHRRGLAADAGAELPAPPPPGTARIPAGYLSAFEDAAARYDLGSRGVWALAAIARLESNFGRGMDRRDCDRAGPLGLEPERVEALRGRRRRRRPHPPRRPRRLGRHPGAGDLVAAAASAPASSPTTRPSGTCRRCSSEAEPHARAAARSPTSTGGSRCRRRPADYVNPFALSSEPGDRPGRPGRRLHRHAARSPRSATPRSSRPAPPAGPKAAASSTSSSTAR